MKVGTYFYIFHNIKVGSFAQRCKGPYSLLNPCVMPVQAAVANKT